MATEKVTDGRPSDSPPKNPPPPPGPRKPPPPGPPGPPGPRGGGGTSPPTSPAGALPKAIVLFTRRFTITNDGPRPRLRGTSVWPATGFGSSSPHSVCTTPGLFGSVA